MAKKFYAQTDALGFPIPGVMMAADVVPAEANILEITKEMTLPAHPGGLKYYVRLDEKGNILPNSLFVHYDTLDQDDVVSLQQTNTPTPTGIAVKVTGDQMFNPVCQQASTNLTVQITSGTTMSDALTITGDFASLGAYFTPVDPTNMMVQPPRFRVAYLVDGKWKSREFKLTAAGVANGSDPMFGISQESFCPQYFAANLYSGDCASPDTVGTPLQVTDGTTITVGKYYKVGADAWLITGTTAPDGMALNINGATQFDTCAAALA